MASSARPFTRTLVTAMALSVLLAGCATRDEPTGAIAPKGGGFSFGKRAALSEPERRAATERWGARFEADKGDKVAALNYAAGLRSLDQAPTASAVLQEASLRHSDDREVLAAYGKVLVDVGQLEQAFGVLERANDPSRPDWRLWSAQGTVLDKMARHGEAQGYYARALKLAPQEASLLSNMGLSRALAGDLAGAEAVLRQAAASKGADARVRQNLTLVLGLQGRFEEAEAIARQDMSPTEVALSMADLREMHASGGMPKG